MTTNLATDAIGPELHRRLGIDLYNGSRSLLELEGRTAEQDAELIHTAHASCHHWRQVGTAANRARGEWLLARVYSVLGRPEPALYHARRCLAHAELGGEGFEDWDLPAAHEAMARAQLVTGDASAARAHVVTARELLELVADPEDRAVIEGDLQALSVG